jgi:hypothetical protein
MKRPILGSLTLFLFLLATGSAGLATDTINQDAVVKIDPYGDGSMKVISICPPADGQSGGNNTGIIRTCYGVT